MNPKINHLTIIITAMSFVIVIGLLAFIATPTIENVITGNTIATVFIEEAVPTTCVTNLASGSNFVSFFCETGVNSIPHSMVDSSNTSLNYRAIFTYNPNNPNDSWSSYNPALPTWAVQQLNALNRYKGYWVIMNTPGTYANSGYKYGSTHIALASGWNLIGYPSDIETSITPSLSPISSAYTRVEGFQNNNGTVTWEIHYPDGTGSLTLLQSMRAYWINMTGAATWTVNW
jgi:hypothetical protein